MKEVLSLKISHVVPTCNGWCSVEKALEMAGLILESKPAVVVEIGTMAGRSLLPLAMALKENGFGVAYGIDPWKNEAATRGDTQQEDKKYWAEIDMHAMHKEAVKGIWEHGLDDYVCLIRATSMMARPLFSKIDFLHLDGNHSTEASMFDVNAYVPILSSGGHVAMDDIDWPTTQSALQILNDTLEFVKDVGTCRIFKKP